AFRSKAPEQNYKLRIWKLESKDGLEHAALHVRAGPPRFSPDSKNLVFETREGGGGAEPPSTGKVRVWDVVSGKDVPWFEKEAKPLRRLAFSPDGRSLATGERKRKDWNGPYEVNIWDLAGGT